MEFHETVLPGAFVIELDPRRDDRGFFARAFDAREFASRNLIGGVAQCNLSYNLRKGTLRGFHYQVEPAAEAKLVRCIRGAVLNVIVDLRPGSATYLHHTGVRLTAANRRSLYIPPLFATAMQTLADETELYYQVGEYYTPGTERGLRHDDPRLGVEWPEAVTEISAKDRSWPLIDDGALSR